jgi:hypothetical protein
LQLSTAVSSAIIGATPSNIIIPSGSGHLVLGEKRLDLITILLGAWLQHLVNTRKVKSTIQKNRNLHYIIDVLQIPTPQIKVSSRLHLGWML